MTPRWRHAYKLTSLERNSVAMEGQRVKNLGQKRL